jgi:hypothetical protein
VVNEFSDVFFEELPIMPPNRYIESVIEVVLETASIYERPYRMATKQLELKGSNQGITIEGLHPS